jgi:hypothetical protein
METVAVRRIGRPRLRWEEDVRADLRKMKIENWCKMATDRKAWKRVVELAKSRRVIATREEEKAKVVPVRAMKAYGGRRGRPVAPLILNICARRKWLTLRSGRLSPRRNHGTRSVGGWAI